MATFLPLPAGTMRGDYRDLYPLLDTGDLPVGFSSSKGDVFVPTWNTDGTLRTPAGGSVGVGGGSRNSAVIIGDSLAAQDTPISLSNFLQAYSSGILQNINYRLGGRLNIVGILGMGGFRSDQLLLSDAGVPLIKNFLDANPGLGYAFIEMGQNDVNQSQSLPRTAPQFKATMREVISLVLSYGVTPILMDILGSAANITTVAMADMWVASNRALRDIAAEYPGVIFAPYSNAVIDVAAAYPANIAATCDGAWHPKSLGSKLLSDYVFNVVDGKIPEIDLFDTHRYAGSAAEMAITTNPLMTGSVAASGILTGVVPTGGLVVGGGTGSGVASLVQNTRGPVGSQWAQVVYTGPASAVNGTDYVACNSSAANVNLSTAGLAAGDMVQACWEVDMTGTASNFGGVELNLVFQGASGTVTPLYGPAGAYQRVYGMKFGITGQLSALNTSPLGYGVITTIPCPIPTGTTSIIIQVKAHPTPGSSGANFTVRFGRHRLKKFNP